MQCERAVIVRAAAISEHLRSVSVIWSSCPHLEGSPHGPYDRERLLIPACFCWEKEASESLPCCT